MTTDDWWVTCWDEMSWRQYDVRESRRREESQWTLNNIRATEWKRFRKHFQASSREDVCWFTEFYWFTIFTFITKMEILLMIRFFDWNFPAPTISEIQQFYWFISINKWKTEDYTLSSSKQMRKQEKWKTVILFDDEFGSNVGRFILERSLCQ